MGSFGFGWETPIIEKQLVKHRKEHRQSMDKINTHSKETKEDKQLLKEAIKENEKFKKEQATKEKIWGMVQQSERTRTPLDLEKKQLKYIPKAKAQEEYLRKQHKAELKSGKFFAKVDEATKGLVPSRQQLKGAFSSIGRNINAEKASWDMARSRTAGTTARSIVEPPRRHLSQENFFEHKTEYEIYGDDEGLTFFDSNKKGNGQRTGSLFGF
jgi:hypothetical protein